MPFVQLRAINTPLAVAQQQSSTTNPVLKKQMNIVSFIYIKDTNVHYDILNENTSEIIVRKDLPFNNSIGIKLKEELLKIKTEYPKFDLLLVSADPLMKYNKLIQVLNECAKQIQV